MKKAGRFFYIVLLPKIDFMLGCVMEKLIQRVWPSGVVPRVEYNGPQAGPSFAIGKIGSGGFYGPAWDGQDFNYILRI